MDRVSPDSSAVSSPFIRKLYAVSEESAIMYRFARESIAVVALVSSCAF